jgi:hypothetical protein
MEKGFTKHICNGYGYSSSHYEYVMATVQRMVQLPISFGLFDGYGRIYQNGVVGIVLKVLGYRIKIVKNNCPNESREKINPSAPLRLFAQPRLVGAFPNFPQRLPSRLALITYTRYNSILSLGSHFLYK